MRFDAEEVLLAPMHVDALPVGTRAPDGQLFQWTDLSPNFEKLGSDALRFPFGSELVSDGDPLQPAAPLEPGVHLHFRLPRAFRHGHKQADAESVSFPTIPNRWLVQRLVGPTEDAGSAPSHRMFLLRSDGEAADDAPALVWPGRDDGRGGIEAGFPKRPNSPIQPFRLGTWEPLPDRPPETEEPARVGLTAVGLGDPMFAAHYPSSRHVLGFHDSLDDLSEASGPLKLTYLVTGWYSAATDDILFDTLAGILWQNGAVSGQDSVRHEDTAWESLTDEERAQIRGALARRDPEARAKLWEDLSLRDAALDKLRDWLSARSWSCPALDAEKRDPGLLPPWRLVSHGTVRDVVWRGAEANYLQPAEADGLRAGGAEVFPIERESAPRHRVVVGQAPGEALAALLVPGAVEQDLLAALQEGVLGQPVTREHLRTELHARRFDGVDGGTLFTTQAEQKPRTTAGAPSRAPRAPAALREEVRRLNADQARFDVSSRRLDAARSHLWGLWKLEAARMDNRGAESDDIYGPQRLAFASIVEGVRAEREEALRHRDVRLVAGDATRPVGDLNEALGAAPARFRLTSTAAQPFFRPLEPVIAVAGAAARVHNAAPRHETTPCRMRGDVFTRLEIETPAARRVAIDVKEILEDCGLTTAEQLDGLHRDLLAEALLLDDAPQSVDRLARLASGREDVTEAVRRAQAAGPDPTPFDYRWQGAPWIPLALAWDIEWASDYAVDQERRLAEDLIDSRWRLDGGADLQADREDGSPAAEVTFRNYAILSTSQFGRLKDGLREIRDDHPLVRAVEDEWACYQRLAGLDAALTMRRVAAELPAFHYPTWSRTGDLVLEDGDGALAPGRSLGPAPVWPQSEPFLPIRSGRLRLRHLAIVDAFGQTRKILTDDIAMGAAPPRYRSTHGIEAGEDAEDYSARLRPRLTQPARLRFDWAEGDAGGPVAGWVVVNWLEQALGIYAADGGPVAVLQKRLGGTSAQTAFMVLPIPGEAAAPRPEQIDDADLRHFYAWAGDLSPLAGGRLFDLLGEAVEAADERVPEDDPAVSLLVGRPLALVRAELGLELMGLPQCRPSLRQAVEGEGYEIETHGLERVNWPVRLGGARLRNDGLVGLFARNEAASGPFVVAEGREGETLPDGFVRQHLRVNAVDPLRVLMLTDPQARVHATTGVLPRRHIELPDDIARDAGRVREVFFQTAPVLGFSQERAPAMPVPSDDFGEWSWAWRPTVSTTATDPDLVRAAERGGFTGMWPSLAEGWLKLRTTALRGLSLWTREPAAAVPAGSVITLVWSGPEAELSLERRPEGSDVWQTLSGFSADGPEPFGRSGEVRQQVDVTTTFRITARLDGESATRELTVTTLPEREDTDE